MKRLVAQLQRGIAYYNNTLISKQSTSELRAYESFVVLLIDLSIMMLASVHSYYPEGDHCLAFTEYDWRTRERLQVSGAMSGKSSKEASNYLRLVGNTIRFGSYCSVLLTHLPKLTKGF